MAKEATGARAAKIKSAAGAAAGVALLVLFTAVPAMATHDVTHIDAVNVVVETASDVLATTEEPTEPDTCAPVPDDDSEPTLEPEPGPEPEPQPEPAPDTNTGTGAGPDSEQQPAYSQRPIPALARGDNSSAPYRFPAIRLITQDGNGAPRSAEKSALPSGPAMVASTEGANAVMDTLRRVGEVPTTTASPDATVSRSEDSAASPAPAGDAALQAADVEAPGSTVNQCGGDSCKGGAQMSPGAFVGLLALILVVGAGVRAGW